eukprot:8800782-Pyramimonas_sp.AAC.1
MLESFHKKCESCEALLALRRGIGPPRRNPGTKAPGTRIRPDKISEKISDQTSTGLALLCQHALETSA